MFADCSVILSVPDGDIPEFGSRLARGDFLGVAKVEELDLFLFRGSHANK